MFYILLIIFLLYSGKRTKIDFMKSYNCLQHDIVQHSYSIIITETGTKSSKSVRKTNILYSCSAETCVILKRNCASGALSCYVVCTFLYGIRIRFAFWNDDIIIAL